MILVRYLVKDIFSHTLSVSLIFLFITFSSRSIQYLEEVVKGNLDSEAVIWLILLRIPEFLEIIIPFSFFIAILLVIGRLYSEGEYVIFQQNGLSTLNISKILVSIGLLLGLILLSINYLLSPLANKQLLEIKAEKNLNQKINLIRPGYFTKVQEDTLFYVNDKDNKNMSNLFIHISTKETEETIIFAEKGEINAQQLKLINGTSFSENESSSQRLSFDELYLSFSDISVEAQESFEFRTSWELLLFLMISGVIALLLSEIQPRESRYKNLIPSLIIYIIYFGLFLFTKESQENLTSWYIHIPFLLLAIYLFIKKRAWYT